MLLLKTKPGLNFKKSSNYLGKKLKKFKAINFLEKKDIILA